MEDLKIICNWLHFSILYMLRVEVKCRVLLYVRIDFIKSMLLYIGEKERKYIALENREKRQEKKKSDCM
jgi:hypothetical protein